MSSVPSDAEIVQTFTRMRDTVQDFSQKLTELEMERNEHDLVVKAIEPLDGDRKCYRMIGGVLVQRTVAEVLPMVKEHMAGIETVMGNLNNQLRKKAEELEEFRARYKINVKTGDGRGGGSGGGGGGGGASGSGASKGVLA